jgi:DNA (cytosine-5)-methyltransferase 1
MDRSATVVDLFCGAGGLSSALERMGWSTVSAVDNDRDAIATLSRVKQSHMPIGDSFREAYLANAKLLHADVSDVRADDLRPRGFPKSWRPTLLAGGPPCQPFSSAGRQAGVDDPRGGLFREFVRIADELRPRFVLFENVRGLITAKCPDGEPGGVLRLVQSSFEEIGYACRFGILNSADFGAPQRRVRLFMLASSSYELPTFPRATHTGKPNEQGLFGLAPWVTLGECLHACPEPDPIDVVRPAASKLAQLEELNPGEGLKARGIVEANRPSGHWGYRQDSFLADSGLPSRTIRAASTPDWIRDTEGELRRLTWRECAALQGFPAEWCFSGSIASRFRQIGNAVEGRIAMAIGQSLLDHSSTARRRKPTSPPWPDYFHKRVRYTSMEESVNGEHRRRARDQASR